MATIVAGNYSWVNLVYLGIFSILVWMLRKIGSTLKNLLQPFFNPPSRKGSSHILVYFFQAEKKIFSYLHKELEEIQAWLFLGHPYLPYRSCEILCCSISLLWTNQLHCQSYMTLVPSPLCNDGWFLLCFIWFSYCCGENHEGDFDFAFRIWDKLSTKSAEKRKNIFSIWVSSVLFGCLLNWSRLPRRFFLFFHMRSKGRREKCPRLRLICMYERLDILYLWR